MRLYAFKWMWLAMLAGGIASGCKDKAPAAPPRPQPVFGQGVIRGRVTFSGQAPKLEPIRNSPCCEGAPETLADETVVVNDKGELANVLVYVSNISASDGSQQPPVVLDQKFCRYVPHVLGVQVGQTLRVTSGDDAPHNTHYNPSKNPARNFVLMRAGEEKTVTFTQSEIIRTKCDVHGWMTAWIGVMDSPFFSVTKEDGTFQILRVPAGNYTLTAWHERFGQLEQQVEVKENGSVETKFEYKAE